MVVDQSSRRHFLLAAGAGVATLAGCQTQENETSTQPTDSPQQETTQPPTSTSSPTETAQTDTNPEDGYPPATDNPPDSINADPSTFETVEKEGPNGETFSISLVPTDVAINWYRRREARFTDARSETEYQKSHIMGAVSSPAPGGNENGGPVNSWPKSDRIVTYCACPHYLSSQRAAYLLSAGYEKVYALDEGFTVWQEENYPVAGEEVSSPSKVWTVSGQVPNEYAGEDAIVTKDEQTEGTKIAADGSYSLHIKFVDVTEDTEVTLKTPAYEATRPLGTFSSGRVTADGTIVTNKNS